jgi:oxygen-independent coproporphyrinogen III oxidase
MIYVILQTMIDHSIYLHVPFCQKRCAYCDFNTWAGKGQLIPAYVDALCKEIQLVAEGVTERSLVSPSALAADTDLVPIAFTPAFS